MNGDILAKSPFETCCATTKDKALMTVGMRVLQMPVPFRVSQMRWRFGERTEGEAHAHRAHLTLGSTS